MTDVANFRKYVSKTLPEKDGRCLAFTLVEVLVVVAIMGILIAILLPAISASRGSARRVACLSNLRQLGLATLQHVDAQGHFPTNGWGNHWLGFKDRGFGRNQPGGWIFNILPYCEAQAVYDLAPTTGQPIDIARLGQFYNSTLEVLLCPERGGTPTIQVSQNFRFGSNGMLSTASRTDYAICVGTVDLESPGGPRTLDPAAPAATGFEWPQYPAFNGMSHVRSRVRPRDVKDGLAHVILLGERLACGDKEAENQPMVSGDCWEIRRCTAGFSGQDGHGIGDSGSFGSAHSIASGFIFCDGSARSLRYDMSPFVYMPLGSRNDGGRQPVDP